MKDDPEPTPEEEITLAKKALAEGKFKRATRHVAAALKTDPTHPEWLKLLDRILKDAPHPLQLVPDDNDVSAPEAAVRSYILANQGKAPQAVEQLLALLLRQPPLLPYLRWATEWLDHPDAAGALDMKIVGEFLGFWVEKYPGLLIESDEDRQFLKPLVSFAKKIDRTQVTDDLFLCGYASLLRKLGRFEEALKVANQAHSAQPGYHTAIALALAHEAMGDMDQWYTIYQKALQHNPNDVPARLDLGDKLWGLGRLNEAERWYKEALQRDPQHPWARPSYFAIRYEMNQDEGWKSKLIEFARSQPGNDRAQSLVARTAPYTAALPTPADATINVARALMEKLAKEPSAKPGGSIAITTDWLESPSARVAVDLQLRVMKLDLAVTYTAEKLQTPDPRKPRVAADFQLWKYKGNTSTPALREPSPETARAVGELAQHPYDLKEWSQRAAAIGPRLGAARVEEVLGVMVHPPLPPKGTLAWTWVYHMQVAAALVLAHLDTGWKGSVRRKALFSVANGPLDWTVAAAIIGLTSISLENAEARPDITKLFVELMKAMPQQGYVPHAHPLVCCFLQFPNLSDQERGTLKEWRKDLESANS